LRVVFGFGFGFGGVVVVLGCCGLVKGC